MLHALSRPWTGRRPGPPFAPGPATLPLALLALLLSLGGCGGPGAGAAGGAEPVVLGVVGPLTEDYGRAMLQGAELAQHEINAAGGIDGRPLELRAYDDEADPGRAIAVADALYRDPEVVGVVGHATSGATSAAAPVYEQGLAAVATLATSPGIRYLGDWIFRVASSDSANAWALAPVARRIAPRAAVLFENDDYGRGLARSFRAAYEAAGGEVVEADPYLPGTEDLTPYLERLRQQQVELVFVAGLEHGAARAVRQAREVGLQARFLGGDGVEGLVDMGEAYEGTLLGLLYHPDHSPAARAFADRFRAAHGRDPGSYAALGYDAVQVLARAARAGGAERRGVRAALAGLGRDGGMPAYQGATGTIAFDEHGDPVDKGYRVGEIRQGAIELQRGL